MAKQESKYAFDEFKLVYESTEKVTDRRLQTNRWNYTICIAMLGAIVALIKYGVDNGVFFYLALALAFFLCGMGILFCRLWVWQIMDFKSLNSAKFQVLNEMAPNIEYTPDTPGVLTPFSPFEKEWVKLANMQALQEYRRTKIVALKSTNIEFFMPNAFVFLFGVIAIVVCLVLLPHKSTYSKVESLTGVNVSSQPAGAKVP